MAIIQGNAKASAGFYPKEIEQSLRFNSADSAYLSWTPASAGNRKTWTFSTWVKRGNLGVQQVLISDYNLSTGTNFYQITFNGSDNLLFWTRNSSANTELQLVTSSVYRDASAWYHIVVCLDTTQVTASDRVKIYVNGDQVNSFSTATYPALNLDTSSNLARTVALGANNYNQYYLDGYLAETHFIDGTAYDATAFGEFKNGVWIPKTPDVTYGTNGFYLDFADGGALGNDVSGNNNDWTPTNLASTDVMLDSPTNNFATLNPLVSRWIIDSTTFSQGNLQASSSSSSDYQFSTIDARGKYYFEMYVTADSTELFIVVAPSVRQNNTGDTFAYYSANGSYGIGTTTGTIATYTTGDIVAIAYDTDNGDGYIYKNGTLLASSTGEDVSSFDDFLASSILGLNDSVVFNFGQDSSFAGNKTPQGYTDANGIGDFYYAPPAGYLALCTANLPEPAIGPNSATTSDEHFNTVLYTGNGSTQSITGVGFQPDLLWAKCRNVARAHALYDAVRGVTKRLDSNTTNAEYTESGVTSFDSDGFTVGSAGGTNASGESFVAWNWKANGSGVTNTDGSITSTVSANVDAGFSIATFTPSGSFTVGHGLSKAPELIITKATAAAGSWFVYTQEEGNTKYLTLETTNGSLTNTTLWQSTSPTSTVWSGNGFGAYEYVALCWHEVEGYSKFGSYTGNGSTDGPFVYCGFRPAFVMVKRTDASGDSWFVHDDARYPNNPDGAYLLPNSSNAEAAYTAMDKLSNGFKLRAVGSGYNASGGTYIFMAFAENPFKYANAR